MSQSISPYALLRASKPKPAPTITTAYDLYSAVQSASSPASSAFSRPVSAREEAVPAHSEQEPSSRQTPVQTAASMPLVPARRTHYIADIQTRHNAALRRTSPLPRPPMM